MPERSKFLETGLTPEYREKFEGRDPVVELQEDLELYNFVAASIRNRVLELSANAKNLKLREEDFKVIESIEDYLDSIEKSLSEIQSQAELFETVDQKESVKIAAVDQVKEKIKRLFIIMSGLENIGHKVTGEFRTTEEFDQVLDRRDRQIYERYFGERIAQKERDLEKLTGAQTLLFNSGMSAIETVLQAQHLGSANKIIVGENFYSQTEAILDKYEERGIRVVRVDTGKADEVIKAIHERRYKEEKPLRFLRFLMLEIIANAPRMEVADLDKIMKAVKQKNDEDPDRPMYLIVDNTFLTPTLNDLVARARKVWSEGNPPVIGIESATKYYQWGLDNINCGIVYSDDTNFMARLRYLRGQMGTNLQGKLASFLPELPRDLFERKMQRHSQNAALLAKLLERFPEKFEVSYPGLESHRDFKTAQKYKGAGSVFYLTCREGINGRKIVDRLKEAADREDVRLNIGMSFGHPETWCSVTERGSMHKRVWVIRIACGSENIGDFKKVMEVFNKVMGELMV